MSYGLQVSLIPVASSFLLLCWHPWIHLANGCPMILLSVPNPSSETKCRKHFIYVFLWRCKWLTSFSMPTLVWCIFTRIVGKFKPRISQQVAKVERKKKKKELTFYWTLHMTSVISNSELAMLTPAILIILLGGRYWNHTPLKWDWNPATPFIGNWSHDPWLRRGL